MSHFLTNTETSVASNFLTISKEPDYMTADRNEMVRAIQLRVAADMRLVWDRESRELRVGDTVVKRFKWPAENQERVLDAFEENGWPPRIADPLPVHPDICPKRRLHDTLKCLNRKQVNGLIKFRGDGTGKGVVLELNLEPYAEPQNNGF